MSWDAILQLAAQLGLEAARKAVDNCGKAPADALTYKDVEHIREQVSSATSHKVPKP